MDTVTRTSAETMDAFFNAFGSGDIPAILDLFSDDSDFMVAGAPNVGWVGRRHGKAEIAEFFASFGQLLTAPEAFSISHKIVDGDEAVAIARCVFGVLATGKKFDNSFALHLTVADGRITRYNMYENSFAIYQAFTP